MVNFSLHDFSHPRFRYNAIQYDIPLYPTPLLQRHTMTSSNGNISTLLALCDGNPPVTGGFPSQKPVTRGVDVSFDLRLNKRLCIQSRRRWFETPSSSLWRHCIMRKLSLIDPNKWILYFNSASLMWDVKPWRKYFTSPLQWRQISVMASQISGRSTVCWTDCSI